jgi:hypothetical protein
MDCVMPLRWTAAMYDRELRVRLFPWHGERSHRQLIEHLDPDKSMCRILTKWNPLFPYEGGRGGFGSHRCKITVTVTLRRHNRQNKAKQTPWSESASKLYRPSDRCLSAKLVPTLANRGCHVVSVRDSYGRILCCLDWSSNFFFQVVPDTLLLRKSSITRPQSVI